MPDHTLATCPEIPDHLTLPLFPKSGRGYSAVYYGRKEIKCGLKYHIAVPGYDYWARPPTERELKKAMDKGAEPYWPHRNHKPLRKCHAQALVPLLIEQRWTRLVRCTGPTGVMHAIWQEFLASIRA